MEPAFSSYIISSTHEPERKQFVQAVKAALPGIKEIEAIYPTKSKVPFLEKLQKKSAERGGRALTAGEIGLILTSRIIWRDIIQKAKNDEEHFLILESDSDIRNLPFLLNQFNVLTGTYDLFFWGAWMGHLRLLNSKRKKIAHGYSYGEPLVNSIACTYGYSMNRKGASTLLKLTGNIAYPLDEFKRYVPTGTLRYGGIVPEVISIHPALPTTIGRPTNQLLEKLTIFVFDLRNFFLSRFR